MQADIEMGGDGSPGAAPAAASEGAPDTESNSVTTQEDIIRSFYEYWYNRSAEHDKVLDFVREHDFYTSNLDEETEMSVFTRLDSLLSHGAAVISRSTGAAIYSVSIWEEDGAIQSAELCDPCLELPYYWGAMGLMHEFIQVDDASSIGPTLGRNLRSAYPSVFGHWDFDQKPFMPPMTGDEEIERVILFRWTVRTLSWQNLPPVDWKRLNDDVQKRTGLLIEPTRLYSNIKEWHHPKDMPYAAVFEINRAVRLGQWVLEQGMKHRFDQVIEFREPERTSSIRTTAHEDSTLQYLPEETIYAASYRTFIHPPNAYVAECGIPFPPFLTEDVQAALRRAATDLHLVGKAIEYVAEYEKLYPTQKPDSADEPALFRSVALNPDNMMTILKIERLPDGFCNFLHKDHLHWNTGELMGWVERGGCTDPRTGRVYGGYCGVLRLLVVHHFLAKTIVWGRNLPIDARSSLIDFDRQIPKVANELLKWIVTHTKQSIEEMPAHESIKIVGNRSAPWPALEITLHGPAGEHGIDSLGWYPSGTTTALNDYKSNTGIAVHEVIDVEMSEELEFWAPSKPPTQESHTPIVVPSPTVEQHENEPIQEQKDSKDYEEANFDSQKKKTFKEVMKSKVASRGDVGTSKSRSGPDKPATHTSGPGMTSDRPTNMVAGTQDQAGPTAGSENVKSSHVADNAKPSRAASGNVRSWHAVSGMSAAHVRGTASPAPSTVSGTTTTNVARRNYLTVAGNHVATTTNRPRVSAAVAASAIPPGRAPRQHRSETKGVVEKLLEPMDTADKDP
ncbi:hypothetical protein RhiJN_24953 [Ceratobasidium sp. AG-Ba]|nr:hypothetical protein RhiJN_24953 [Ceratobasidium sp. AG-Ba]